MQIPFAIIKRGLGRDEVTRKVEPPLGKGDVLFPLVKREKRGGKKKIARSHFHPTLLIITNAFDAPRPR